MRVVGRYRIHGVIGTGGMASVHLGRLRGDAGFARLVAIKRLHDSFATDPSFVAMFTDEARLAARIRHPNVVPTLDVVASGDALFHVIEYVHGETVAKLAWAAKQARQSVPVDVVVRIICDALLGLHAAHEATDEQGQALCLVHRDVSPQNVIVGVDGVTRVLDFGVAKARGVSQTTKSGGIKGKVGYMPPEQLYGEPVDRRADIYAAGVVLWELVAGKRLFAGEGGEDALALALTAPVWRPSIHCSDIPDALDEIVLRALERDRDKRFTSAQQMADALVEAVVPAQPSKVATWVKALAGPAIEKRALMITNIEANQETATDPAEFEAAVEDRSLLGEPTTAAITMAPISQPRTHRLAAVLAVALLAMTVVVMALVWNNFSSDERMSDRVVSATPTNIAPTGSTQSTAKEATAATASVAATVSTPVPEATQSASAEPSHKVPPPPPKRWRPPVVAKPNCNPPWEIDQNGHRRYKRECLR
jgi:eukaryotic-like serine/threonine-protein kinase